MARNESTIDRIIRAVIGAAALVGAVAVGATSGVGLVLLVLGGILLVTGAVGFCPLYRILGMSTQRASHR